MFWDENESETQFGLSASYRLQEDEGLGEQVAEEMVVSQSDALKVSGGVNLLKQLRELRLQHVNLQTDRKTTRSINVGHVWDRSLFFIRFIKQFVVHTCTKSSLALFTYQYIFVFHHSYKQPLCSAVAVYNTCIFVYHHHEFITRSCKPSSLNHQTSEQQSVLMLLMALTSTRFT